MSVYRPVRNLVTMLTELSPALRENTEKIAKQLKKCGGLQ